MEKTAWNGNHGSVYSFVYFCVYDCCVVFLTTVYAISGNECFLIISLNFFGIISFCETEVPNTGERIKTYG